MIIVELKIRNIDFNYEAEGQIANIALRFDSYETDGTTLNGSIRISEEEYNQNATNLTALAGLAKSKLATKINA